MMKQFFDCLAILVILLAAGSQTAGSAELETLYVTTGETVECEIYLRPGIDKIWGSYICEGGCNGNIVSAKPNFEGRPRCKGCGKAHTGEEIIPPRHIRRGGKIYFIAEASMVQRKDGTEGNRLNCPFCGTESNPKLASTCPGCSAQYDLKRVSEAVAPQGTDVTITDVSNLARSHDPTELTTQQKVTSKLRSSVSRPSFLSSLPNSVKVAAAAAATASTIGLFVWGNGTYSEVGVVQQVIGSEYVIVSVTSDQVTTEYKLNIRGDETIEWRVGEKVEFFFNNFKGVQGAERANSDTYDAAEF